MSDDIPMKHCHKCNQSYPATREFFYRDRSNKKFGLKTYCISCDKKIAGVISRDNGHISARALSKSIGIDHSIILKDIQSGILQATNIGRKTKKVWAISPDDAEAYQPSKFKSKTGTPEQCGACGTTISHIFGDVDPDTQEKYGYLCGKCSKLVRDFQGDPKRMRNVLSYVERTRQTVIHKKCPPH